MSDDTTQGSFLRAFDALREQLKTEFVDVETLRNQLLEARIKNDQLTAELERVKEELIAQRASWAECQQAMAGKSPWGQEPPPPQKMRFGSVFDAVQHAKDDFSYQLRFLETALESAQDATYQEPEKLYKVFEMLADVVREWQENRGRLGRPWNVAMTELGVDFRDQASKTTKRKDVEQFTFFYKGASNCLRRILMLAPNVVTKASRCIAIVTMKTLSWPSGIAAGNSASLLQMHSRS